MAQCGYVMFTWDGRSMHVVGMMCAVCQSSGNAVAISDPATDLAQNAQFWKRHSCNLSIKGTCDRELLGDFRNSTIAVVRDRSTDLDLLGCI